MKHDNKYLPIHGSYSHESLISENTKDISDLKIENQYVNLKEL